MVVNLAVLMVVESVVSMAVLMESRKAAPSVDWTAVLWGKYLVVQRAASKAER